MGYENNYTGGQESLLEYIFRHRILRDRERNSSEKLWMEDEAEFAQRMAGDMGEDLRNIEHVVVRTGLGPEAVLVKYGDEFGSRLSAIEPDLSRAPGPAGRKAENLFQYLSQLREELAESRAHRRIPRIELTYHEIQEHAEWVQTMNFMGDKVRLAGITPAIFNFVLGQAATFFAARGVKLVNLLFYGSRVMTRDEVVKRQPDLVELLPTVHQGVAKNRVRLRGDNISDFQVRLIYDKLSYPFADPAVEKSLHHEFRRWLTANFRIFPVSALLIPVLAGDSPRAQFHVALQKMIAKERYGEPWTQYASFSQTEWWNDFPQGSGQLADLEEIWVRARANAP